MISPRRALALFLLVVSATHVRATDEPADPPEISLPLEPVAVEPALATQRTDVGWLYRAVVPTPTNDLETAKGEIRIGKLVLAARVRDDGFHVATRPGAAPREKVTEGGAIEVQLDAKHRATLLFRRRAGVSVVPRSLGGWQFAVVSGYRLTYDKIPIQVLDLNGDGAITTDGRDGYREPGNPLTLPLGKTLTFGADRLTLVSISADEVVATARRLAEDTDQRVGLASVNAMRLEHGLPPVTIDPELSDACTSHAVYLKMNGWNGYTDPHTEDEDTPGYTHEGALAARKSVIMQAGHAGAIRAYLRTYYHRAPFMDPFLKRVGISSGEPWISVIDATSAAPVRDERHPDWKDPILLPADGATNVETDFCRWGEVPEPTSRPAARGFPLTLLFARWDHGVLDVHAELVRFDDDDGSEIPVETLVPEAMQESKLMGVVPAEPLLPGTRYRVRYRLERFEEPDQHVEATFTTAPTKPPRRR